MGERYGQEPDEGAHGRGVQYGAVGQTTVGVGAVEYDDVDPFFRTGLHDEHEGGEVRVATHPHVLDVEQHDVELGQLSGSGLFVGAIETVDGQSRGRVQSA